MEVFGTRDIRTILLNKGWIYNEDTHNPIMVSPGTWKEGRPRVTQHSTIHFDYTQFFSANSGAICQNYETLDSCITGTRRKEDKKGQMNIKWAIFS